MGGAQTTIHISETKIRHRQGGCLVLSYKANVYGNPSARPAPDPKARAGAGSDPARLELQCSPRQVNWPRRMASTNPPRSQMSDAEGLSPATHPPRALLLDSPAPRRPSASVPGARRTKVPSLQSDARWRPAPSAAEPGRKRLPGCLHCLFSHCWAGKDASGGFTIRSSMVLQILILITTMRDT